MHERKNSSACESEQAECSVQVRDVTQAENKQPKVYLERNRETTETIHVPKGSESPAKSRANSFECLCLVHTGQMSLFVERPVEPG